MTRFLRGLKPCSFNFLLYLLLTSGLVCLFSSCKTIRNSYEFREVKRDTAVSVYVSKNLDLKIQKTDILTIKVTSLSPEDDAIFNNSPSAVASTVPAMEMQSIVGMSNTSSGAELPSSSMSSSSSTSGAQYPLDTLGNINMHRLGSIHVEGSTLIEVQTLLQKDLQPYLKDAIITVYFANHRVTVMGSVGHPGIIPIPQEGLTILNALALSGDAGQQLSAASLKDILIIRDDSADHKQIKHINLENTSVFNSPWYYLQDDDIVYVQPNNEKLETEANRIKTAQIISIAASAISILVLIIDQVSRK